MGDATEVDTMQISKKWYPDSQPELVYPLTLLRSYVGYGPGMRYKRQTGQQTIPDFQEHRRNTYERRRSHWGNLRGMWGKRSDPGQKEMFYVTQHRHEGF